MTGMDRTARLQEGLFYFLGALLAVSAVLRFSWDPVIYAPLHGIIVVGSAVFGSLLVRGWETPRDLPPLLVLTAVSLSLIHSPDPATGLRDLLPLLDGLLLCWLAALLTEDRYRRLLFVPALIGVWIAVMLLMGRFTGGLNRFLLNPNVCAGYVLLAFLVLLPRWRDPAARWLLLVHVAGLAAARSRVALVIAGGGLLALAWRSLRPWARIAALGGGVALLIAVVWTPSGQDSFIARIAWWHAGGRMFADAPMSGMGWGQFAAYLARYRTVLTENSLYAHNILVQFLAETGLIGLAALLGFIAVRARWTPAVLAIAGFLAFNLTDYSFFVPAHMFLFFFLLARVPAPPARERTVWALPVRLSFTVLALGTALMTGWYAMTHAEGAERATRKARHAFSVYALSGDRDALAAACAFQRDAARRSPATARYWSDLAWLHRTAGDMPAARTALLTALRTDPLGPRNPELVRSFWRGAPPPDWQRP